MRFRTRSARSLRRPNVEPLENRCVPALGLFIENFASDLDPTQPGWDSFDADHATLPPGPDELLFRNDFPPAAMGGTNGPTATGGYLAIETRTTPFDPPPYGAHAVTLLSSESLPGIGSVTFSFPHAGQPGGPLLGEEIAAIGIDFRGVGQIIIEGTGARRHPPHHLQRRPRAGDQSPHRPGPGRRDAAADHRDRP